jgi:hypothetical protein
MILDARRGDTGYTVYDAKRCLFVSNDCLWVDSDTAQWGRMDRQASRSLCEPETEIMQEDRITIYLDHKLVVFNEVEDGELNIVEQSVYGAA